MASTVAISQSQTLLNPQSFLLQPRSPLPLPPPPAILSLSLPCTRLDRHQPRLLLLSAGTGIRRRAKLTSIPPPPPLRRSARIMVFASATTAEMPKKKGPDAAKGFVDEMRAVAMRLHTRDQAREGEKKPDAPSVAKWEPSLQGYLRFLIDSKLVYDTLEFIVRKASCPWYAEFRNTGLERSEKLMKDLEWFRELGYMIPEPSSPGVSYARYLDELSEKDPQAFICHFYNVYFAHTAGGRMIGRKVAEKVLDNKELEFYKWDGDLLQLLQNVREKLNRVSSDWSREEKDHCLEETEKSFKYSGEILRLILSK